LWLRDVCEPFGKGRREDNAKRLDKARFFPTFFDGNRHGAKRPGAKRPGALAFPTNAAAIVCNGERLKTGQYRLLQASVPISDCGFRIAECGMIRAVLSSNPQSEIRIPQCRGPLTQAVLT